MVALREWLAEGPAIAVLEGFHGVGKTVSVTKLVQETQVPTALVPVTSNGDVGLQDLLLDVAGELELSGNSFMADSLEDDQLGKFDAILRQPCLVVIDDFTELLSPDTGLPPPSFVKFLVNLERRPSALGRLLLVTDRRLTLAEDLDLKRIRLGPPTEQDAVRLLSKMLEIREREKEVPPARRLDVVRWLGCNPRAFQALVACLEDDSLDELISSEQENWDLKDEAFSPALIKELERRFRARTLNRLSPAGLLLIQYLSIYRRPFVSEGVGRFAERVGDINSARRDLANLFLLDHDRRWFFLNPVSRELALSRLREDSRHLLDAHSLAADHYCRHFRAKGSANLTSHGAEFVEARYHLSCSDRLQEFTYIASRYRSYLLGNFGHLKAIPPDVTGRTQLIATLTAALSDDQPGYPDARFTLARLLHDSPVPGDKVRALRQATIACRESTFSGVWVLRIRLSAELEPAGTTLSIVRQAETLLPDNAMTDVYYAAAKALAEEGLRATELITLVNDAMRRRASDPEAWVLFQLGAAILARLRRYDDAIELLRGYLINTADLDFMFQSRLVEQALLLGHAAQRRDSLASLEPLADSLGCRLIFESLQALQKGDYESVCLKADGGSGVPASVKIQAAFAELCMGYPYRAQKRLSSLRRRYGRAQYWLSSLIALCLEDVEVARAGLEAYLGRRLRGDESLVLATWIKVWSDTAGSLDSNAPFWFPRLPAELTGLDYELVRLQDADYVIDAAVMAGLPDRPMRRSEDREEVAVSVQDPPTNVLADAPPRLINVINISQEGSHMGDKNIVGQAAAVGSHASASNVTLQQVAGLSGIDMSVLGKELGLLRTALREQPSSEDNDEALAEVSRAARAAIEGDEAKVASHLKASGQWAFRTANAIGATVAAAAIKHALGM